MHITAHYIAVGFLIASMLLAAAMALLGQGSLGPLAIAAAGKAPRIGHVVACSDRKTQSDLARQWREMADQAEDLDRKKIGKKKKPTKT